MKSTGWDDDVGVQKTDAGFTGQRSLIVEVEGCISVKPVRFRMRLGREHVLVCIEVPP